MAAIGFLEKAHRGHGRSHRRVVPPARFERTTFPLGGGRSIQLSYGGISRAFSHEPVTGWESGAGCRGASAPRPHLGALEPPQCGAEQ